MYSQNGILEIKSAKIMCFFWDFQQPASNQNLGKIVYMVSMYGSKYQKYKGYFSQKKIIFSL
jgi:hypothetical protein